MTKQKHHHKKNRKHRHHRSLFDSEHRHRKSSSGKGDPRKRKHKHSPSSSSSEASSETGSDSDASTDENIVSSNDNSSDMECSSKIFRKYSKHSRKKAKHLRKESKAFAEGKKLISAFTKNFAKLALLVSGPELLAAQLYSCSLISQGTLDKIITLPTSRLQKSLVLLSELDRNIRANPEKLFEFIQVIQGDPSLEEVAEKMLHLAGRSTYSVLIIMLM